MQQRFYESEADITKSKIQKVQQDKVEMALQNLSEARENRIQLDSVEYVRNLAFLQNRIDQNSASLVSMRRELQQSNDSAVYYRDALLKSQQDIHDGSIDHADKKWYQKIFTSKRKERDKIEGESAIREQTARQQQFYDEDARNLQTRVTDLERKNNDLINSYRSYNDDRSYRRRYDVPVTPVVVYSGDRNSDRKEIDDLKAQLQNLQNEIDYDARGRQLAVDSVKADTSQAKKIDSLALPKITTPVVAASPPVIIGDTSELKTLRRELDQLRTQLDSMKNKRESLTVLPEKKPASAKTETNYDVASFPVISVYFKSGTVSLSQDQLNKIAPLGKIATKNNDAQIVLKGFTDATGNPDKNKIIANRRSGYVKNVLLTKYRIFDSRIIIEEPEVAQSGSSGKANPLDRRVDLQLR